jgi:hypothetical protein
MNQVRGGEMNALSVIQFMAYSDKDKGHDALLKLHT